MMKQATHLGVTFKVGQFVVAKGDLDEAKIPGKILGFVHSVNGAYIIARIRVGKSVARAYLGDIEPSTFNLK